MRTLPPEPQVGDRVTADLIRELIRCIRERQLLKGPNYTISTGPNGTYLKFDLPKSQNFPRDPLPFEVRWNDEANSNAGAWIVYVPNDFVLMYAGNYLVPEGTAALENLDGWKIVSDANKQSTGIFVNITADDVSTATISATASGDISIRLAAVSYNTDSSSATVVQDVVGELVIGSVSDEKSTSEATGKQEIFGWSTQAAEQESLASRLDSTSPAALELVARFSGDNNRLLYIPIGSFFKKSEEGEGTVSPTANPTVEIVGDIKYDISDHQLKKRIDTVDLRTGAVVQGNWVMIEGGQATPHTGEMS